MTVNLFLSRDVWTLPLNRFGVQQHVYALYEEVFRGTDVEIYPKGQTGALLTDGLRHVPAMLKGRLNVLCPSYPVVAGAMASLIAPGASFIVHTWKVPGQSDHRLSARIHDSLLRRVMSKARAVVVASMHQKRQLEAQGLRCPVVFAPVSVDSRFWHHNPDGLDGTLAGFGLQRNHYVLTVGGSDRDEIYAARTAQLLGLPYVRATYSPQWAAHAKAELAGANLTNHATILINPSDEELRALYAGAWLVCLPTVTRTNPAGLTSLVEGMSCGAVVAVPETIADQYVKDGSNGFLLADTPDELVSKLNLRKEDFPAIRQRARETAEGKLNNKTISKSVRQVLESVNISGR